jgi:predicted transcriptional regulator of viral defense system
MAACCVAPSCFSDAMERSWSQVARSQYGVISRAQALESGLSKDALSWKLRTQELEAIQPGAYLVSGAPNTWRQSVMAALLSCPGSVAACRTAGALYGLIGCQPREIEILVNRPVMRRPEGIIIRRTKHLEDVDVTVVEGIPTTSPARTLLDLGAVMHTNTVRHALQDAVRKGLVSVSQLHEQLARVGKRGRPGTAAFRTILDSFDSEGIALESPLEEELIKVIQRSGLPPPLTQFQVWDEGILIARLDAAYPDLRVGVEADGYEWHSARPDWVRDRRRQNELVSRNWTLLRFCIEDAKRPAPFVAALKRLYLSKVRELSA